MEDLSNEYSLVAERPEVFAFLVGWKGQEIAFREEEALESLCRGDDNDRVGPSAAWGKGLSELCHVAHMCAGWHRHTQGKFPDSILQQIRGLLYWFKGGGDDCNKQLLTSLQSRMDAMPRVGLGKGTSYVPDLLDPNVPCPKGLVSKKTVIASLITGIGESTNHPDEVRLGAKASGFCRNVSCRIHYRDVAALLSELVTKDLLSSHDKRDFLPPDRLVMEYTYSDEDYENEAFARFRRHSTEFLRLPALVCARAGISLDHERWGSDEPAEVIREIQTAFRREEEKARPDDKPDRMRTAQGEQAEVKTPDGENAGRKTRGQPPSAPVMSDDGKPFFKPSYFKTWNISDELLRRNAANHKKYTEGKVRREKKKATSGKGKRAVYWYSEPDARKRWPDKFVAAKK